jgi:cytochrome c oxidase assembly factor CtaG
MKGLLTYSLLPILCGVLVGIVALYVIISSPPEYNIVAWDEIFHTIMTEYLVVVSIIATVNMIFIFTKGKKTYDSARNSLYNGAGFILALVSFLSWYVL